MKDHDRGVTLPPLASELDPLPVPWLDEGSGLPPIADHIRSLMAERGHGGRPGLVGWKAGTERPAGRGRRLRKLLLRPREFFADSKLPVLRSLGRLFPR
jgi:hypothetical protein